MSVLNRYRERGEVYEKYPAALYTGVKNEVCGIYHTYHTVLGTRDDRTSGRVRLILVESHSKRSRRLRCGGGEGMGYAVTSMATPLFNHSRYFDFATANISSF